MDFRFTFILLIFITGNAIAQDSVWTLEACIVRAQEENIMLQITELNVRSADVSLKRSRHSRWPSLSASSNFGYNFGRTIDPTSNEFITTSLGFQGISLNSGALLFNANRINNSIRRARMEKDVSTLDYEQSKRDLALEVANLYLNALLAKENLRIAEAQRDNARKQAERSRKLVNSGAQPEVTLLEFEAEAASREQAVIQAGNNLYIALLQLKQILQLGAEVPFDISAPPESIPIEGAKLETAQVMYQKALNTFPSYEAAQKSIRSAQLNKNIAQAAFYPSLSIGGNLNSNYSTEGRTLEGVETMTRAVPASFNGESGTLLLMTQNPVFSDAGWATQINENLGYGVGLQLNIPIYNNYLASSDFQLAKIGEIRAEKELALEEQNIRIELEQSIADKRAAAKSYEAAQRSFEAAQLAFQNVERRYELGVISVYDLLESEQRRDTAQLNMLLAKYNYIFAQKVLEFYTGQEIKL